MNAPDNEQLCEAAAGPAESAQAIDQKTAVDIVEQPGPSEIAPNFGVSTRKEAERARLAEWLALTGPERIERGMPTTQRQLAAELGVCESTLSTWKSDPSLQREVSRRLRAICQEEAPAVIRSQAKKAIAESDTPAARLVLDHAMPVEKSGVAVGVQVNRTNAELVATADADYPLPEWFKKQQRQQDAASEELPADEIGGGLGGDALQ